MLGIHAFSWWEFTMLAINGFPELLECFLISELQQNWSSIFTSRALLMHQLKGAWVSRSDYLIFSIKLKFSTSWESVNSKPVCFQFPRDKNSRIRLKMVIFRLCYSSLWIFSERRLNRIRLVGFKTSFPHKQTRKHVFSTENLSKWSRLYGSKKFYLPDQIKMDLGHMIRFCES